MKIPKRIRKRLEKALSIPEVKELQNAMLHSHRTVKVNGVLVQILKASFEKLKLHGYREVKYEWQGVEHTANFKEEMEDINRLIELKHIEE